MTEQVLQRLKVVGLELFDHARKYIAEHPEATDADVTKSLELVTKSSVTKAEWTREELEEVVVMYILKTFHQTVSRMTEFTELIKRYEESKAKTETPKPQ